MRFLISSSAAWSSCSLPASLIFLVHRRSSTVHTCSVCLQRGSSLEGSQRRPWCPHGAFGWSFRCDLQQHEPKGRWQRRGGDVPCHQEDSEWWRSCPEAQNRLSPRAWRTRPGTYIDDTDDLLLGFGNSVGRTGDLHLTHGGLVWRRVAANVDFASRTSLEFHQVAALGSDDVTCFLLRDCKLWPISTIRDPYRFCNDISTRKEGVKQVDFSCVHDRLNDLLRPLYCLCRSNQIQQSSRSSFWGLFVLLQLQAITTHSLLIYGYRTACDGIQSSDGLSTLADDQTGTGAGDLHLNFQCVYMWGIE